MAEVADGGNKFLVELKNALRKLNKSQEDDDSSEKAEVINSSCTSDTLTPGDTTTCTYSYNDATMSSTLTLNGDVTTDSDKVANDRSAILKPPDPAPTAVNHCDHKAVPYVAAYDSKVAQRGIAEAKHTQPNGRLPGIHLLNENPTNKLVPSGLKVQVSDMETPEGSNASSPKTMSTVYSSDKESTIQRRRSDPKTPSPAPRPITEAEAACLSQRPPRARNMKMAQADLYNELNSVLKKRNQMTRRSSIMELERQRGCKTIVYYGRGGASSGQLNRKGSVASNSPSPMAPNRIRTDSMTSKADSIISDSGSPAVESPLPPSGMVRIKQHKKVMLSRTQSDVSDKCQSKLREVEETQIKPDTKHNSLIKLDSAWIPPPTIGPDSGKAIATNLNSSENKPDAKRTLNETRRNDSHPPVKLQTPLQNTYANVNSVNQIPGPNKLLANLTQSQFHSEDHVSISEPSEADSIVSKELIELRKAFDTVDSKNITPRSPTMVVGSEEPKVQTQLPKVTNEEQPVSSTEPRITVEIQWPKNPPTSYLHDELRRWHERLSGKWKNQDEEDIMDDRATYYSDEEEVEALRHADWDPMLDRENPSGASHSSGEGARSPTPRLQLPRAALSPSTKQRLRDIKQNAAKKLFAKAEELNGMEINDVDAKSEEKLDFNADGATNKQFREVDTEEEEKESSIDFPEEVHPGSLVSHLVDKVRSSNVETPTARAQCDDATIVQNSDTSSELSVEGSLAASGSDYRGSLKRTRSRASNNNGNGANLPTVTSDVSLTSVTSYDISPG